MVLDTFADRSALDSRIQTTLRAAGVPGAVVSITIDGKDNVTRGVGHQDALGEQPLSDRARFYIYSATKPLIATAVLRLVERGRVELDRPLRAYLPELPQTLDDERITIRRLLNHTAGLPDYGPLPEYGAAVKLNPGEPWTEKEFLDRTLAGGLAYEPGEGWGYSNIGFMLLKLLVERLNNATLDSVLRKEIFEPLDLNDPIVASSLADAVHLSPGFSTYLSSEDQIEDISQTYHPGWVSHGVVIATAEELARMIDEVVRVGGSLLTPASRELMLDPVILPFEHPGFVQPAYGLGVMIDAASPYGAKAGHGGGGPGYSIGAFHFSDVVGHTVTIAAIANSDISDLGTRLTMEAFEVTRGTLGRSG